MFEQLFEGTQALAHQRAGPLLEERLRHLNHLATQAMSWHYLRHTAHYLLAVATNIYAEVDLEMKAKALANCEVEEDEAKKPWREDGSLMAFLRSL